MSKSPRWQPLSAQNFKIWKKCPTTYLEGAKDVVGHGMVTETKEKAYNGVCEEWDQKFDFHDLEIWANQVCGTLPQLL